MAAVVAYPSRHVWYHSGIRARRFGTNIRLVYVSCRLNRLCESILKNILSRIVDPALEYPLYKGFVHLGAGLACGLTGMAAGYAVGYVGDAVRVPLFPFLLL